MKLLFFQDTLGVGGGEIWAIDAAAKLRDRGHSVSVGCPSGSWMERRSEAHGLPYFDYPIEEELECNLRWQLADHLRENEIDVILCSIPGYRTEVPLLEQAIRESGHGRTVLRLGVSPGPGALSPDRIGLHSDAVPGTIVVSHEVKARLIGEFPALDPDRIHVIYNGVDLSRFDPAALSEAERQQARRSLDIPDEHRVVTTVGRLDPIKNTSLLVSASHKVLDRFPDTTFLVVGDGSEREALTDEVEQKGVSDHFRFAGFVENMPQLLASIDIYVHTSLSEGLPNAVLEAMAMARPVVATEVGGTPELIESGKDGILISPGDTDSLVDHLTGLLGDTDRRQQIGVSARRRVESDFDRRRKIEELEALLAGEAKRPRGTGLSLSLGPPELYPLPSLFQERACALHSLGR